MMQGLQDLNVIKASKQELLMTSVPPLENVSIFNISGVFRGSTPLRTRAFESWPTRMDVCCLHCGSQCDMGPPLPAVKFFEPQLNVYWVQGPFCSAPCSLGYITENEGTSGSKQMALTIVVHRQQFGIHDIRVAPPRSSHVRQGGPLTDMAFRGLSEAAIRDVVSPPFVSFAQYIVANRSESITVKESQVLPQSSGKFIDLARPTTRDFDVLERKPTMRAPQLLNFLAEFAPELLAKKEGPSVKASEENLIEGNSRKRKEVTKEASVPKGFLAQYMTKKD